MTDAEIINALECCGNMECNDDCPLFCKYGCQKYLMTKTIDLIKRQQVEIEKYKDLEEQGRLIELPCKVGDTVYFIDESEIYFDKVNNIEIRKVKGETIFCIGYMDYRKEDFGKIAFLTKAEAEAKLKELVGEANDR